MEDIRMISISIDDEKNTIRYFKSKDNKIWISLDDILVSISFDLDLSNYVSIMNSCNDKGEVKLHKRTVIRKNPDYGYLYVEDRHGTDVYISFPCIDILTKIKLSYGSNKKLKKVKDKLQEELIKGE